MTISEIKSLAETFSVPVASVVAARMRRIKQQIATKTDLLFKVLVYTDNELEGVLNANDATMLIRELTALSHQIESLRGQEKGRVVVSERKTDDEIDRANSFPMDQLIEFNRAGKAHAPCHDDKNPSMYYGKRMNLGVCPVCDKRWTPVKWCVDQMGMGFREAVDYLNGR